MAQNWRRHITFSSTILSLLVALVSVAGLAIPPIVDTFTPHTSKLSSQVLSVGEISADYADRMAAGDGGWGYVGLRYCLGFTVLMQNAGNAPGVLKDAQIFLHSKDGRIAAQGDYQVPPADAVIKPNDFRAVEVRTELTVNNRALFPEMIRLSPDQHVFRVDYDKGKVMLRLVANDGAERPEPHSLFGRVATARVRKGGCGQE